MDKGPCCTMRASDPYQNQSSSPGQFIENVQLRRFLVDSFRSFEPLLSASEDYARYSGYRFRGADFQDCAERLPDYHVGQVEAIRAAKMKAYPVVESFAERLRAGELALVEEIERAFKLVMIESVRNAMVGTCQHLEMWPPQSSPVDVDAEDCSYEDVSAPLPVIAQRLYNDEVRRNRHLIGVGGLCRLRQRAMTAAFLIDFVQEVGAALPAMPETQAMMLQEFSALVASWEHRSSCTGVDFSVDHSTSQPQRSNIYCGLPFGTAGPSSQGTISTGRMLGNVLLIPYSVLLYAAALGMSADAGSPAPSVPAAA